MKIVEKSYELDEKDQASLFRGRKYIPLIENDGTIEINFDRIEHEHLGLVKKATKEIEVSMDELRDYLELKDDEIIYDIRESEDTKPNIYVLIRPKEEGKKC